MVTGTVPTARDTLPRAEAAGHLDHSQISVAVSTLVSTVKGAPDASRQ